MTEDIELGESHNGALQPRGTSRRNRRSWRKLLDAVVVATIPEARCQENLREAPERAIRVPTHESRPGSIDETDATFGLWNDTYEVKTAGESYNCCPPPIFVPLITVVQIAVFIFYAVRLKDVTFDRGGVDFDSPLIYDPALRFQAWRFLSYALLHHGVFHILTNSLLQLTLGCVLELQHKLWRVAPLYFLGVIAGSLASSVADPFVFLVGASGGVYALLGGHVATVVINWHEMQKGWRSSVAKFAGSGVCRLIIVFLLVAADTGVAVYTRYAAPTTPNSKKRVSYAAHLGSLVVGALTGIFFLRNLKIRRWEKIVCIVAIIVYILLVIAAIVFNLLCAGKELCPRMNI